MERLKGRDISCMFYGAQSFDQPLDEWDTSSVTDMGMTFSMCPEFDQNIDSWNTSKVEDMSGMFTKTARFNQPLNSWRTGCVRDMSGMFRGASSFDQPLDKWDVSRVETAEKMFNDASCFSRPLDMWQIPRACNVNDMFLNAPRFKDLRTLALNFFLTNKKKYREYLKEVLGRFDAAQVYAELSRYDCKHAAEYIYARAGSGTSRAAGLAPNPRGNGEAQAVLQARARRTA